PPQPPPPLPAPAPCSSVPCRRSVAGASRSASGGGCLPFGHERALRQDAELLPGPAVPAGQEAVAPGGPGPRRHEWRRHPRGGRAVHACPDVQASQLLPVPFQYLPAHELALRSEPASGGCRLLPVPALLALLPSSSSSSS
ncbi:unnamed protein product, partial [Prorocentrum cordatum]